MQARRFRFEDQLTARERAEAEALFRAGKWKRGQTPQNVFARQRAAFLLAQEGLPVTVHGKLKPTRQVITVGEAMALVTITGAAFLFGRWWGQRRKTKRAGGLHGLDVFVGA